MEDKSPNGNHAAFQVLHAERSLENWPDVFGHHHLACESTCWAFPAAWWAPKSVCRERQGEGEEGWLWDGNAALAPINVQTNTPPCAKLWAAPALDNHHTNTSQGHLIPGLPLCIVLSSHIRGMTSQNQNILQGLAPILPQKTLPYLINTKRSVLIRGAELALSGVSFAEPQ